MLGDEVNVVHVRGALGKGSPWSFVVMVPLTETGGPKSVVTLMVLMSMEMSQWQLLMELEFPWGQATDCW